MTGKCFGSPFKRGAGLSIIRRLMLALFMICLLVSPALAADEAIPTVAFLRFGASQVYRLTDQAVFNMLHAYGYVTGAERDRLAAGDDVHGGKINILIRDAGFDLSAASLMVEDALDEGADALLTVSNEVGALAAQAMQGMEDPPTLIFAIVTNAQFAGLVDAPCLKPDYMTGTEMNIDYEDITDLPFMQDPDFKTMGVLFDGNDPASAIMEQRFHAFAQELGMMVELETYLSLSDLTIAAEALLDKGVDALYLAPGTSTPERIGALVSVAFGVPVYSSIATDVAYGATISAGFEGWYREGLNAARLLISHLRGELDIAKTAVSQSQGALVAGNLASAEAQGVIFSEAFLERADLLVDAEMGIDEVLAGLNLVTEIPEMTLEERIAADRAFLEGLHCSPEMIAEQQAALDSP